MSGTDRLEDVQRWLLYARDDLAAAQAAVGRWGAAPRLACWLAQQAAEKALKAVLIFLDIDFPRRHDLDALRNLVPHDWRLKTDHPDLSELTEWAVEARYPGDWPDATEADARTAVQQAGAVWRSVIRDLKERGLDVAGKQA